MNQTETTLIIIAVIIAVVGLRIWRATREQRVRLASIWVAPAIFAVLIVWIGYVDGLTSPLDIAFGALAIVAGGAIGMYQGTHTTVRIDRTARAMFVKVRPLGVALFLAVFFARFFVRLEYGYPSMHNGSLPSGTMPLPPKGELVSLISFLLLGIALGSVAGLRLYLFRKYHEPDAPAAG